MNTNRSSWAGPLRGLKAVGLIAALVIVPSCTPDSGFNTVSDYDIVATYYAPDTEFDSLETYVMPGG